MTNAITITKHTDNCYQVRQNRTVIVSFTTEAAANAWAARWDAYLAAL